MLIVLRWNKYVVTHHLLSRPLGAAFPSEQTEVPVNVLHYLGKPAWLDIVCFISHNMFLLPLKIHLSLDRCRIFTQWHFYEYFCFITHLKLSYKANHLGPESWNYSHSKHQLSCTQTAILIINHLMSSSDSGCMLIHLVIRQRRCL